MRVDLEVHPMHPCRTVADRLRHVLKQLEGTHVRSGLRSDSPDLWHTPLDLGVTGLLARPKA